MLEEELFDGTDDEIELIIINPRVKSENYPNGTPIDFISLGTTSMELCFGGQEFNSDNGDVTYADGGVVKIKPADVSGVSKDISHSASLKVIDELHPKGQTIIHPTKKYANMNITVVSVCTC